MEGWGSVKDTRIFAPLGAHKFVGRASLERFEALGNKISPQKGLQVGVERFGGGVLIALDRGRFQRPVHALGLAVGPGMSRFDETVREAVLVADLVEDVAAAVPVVGQVAELPAVSGEHGVHLLRHRGQHLVQHQVQKARGNGLRGSRGSPATATLRGRSTATTKYGVPAAVRSSAKSTCK